MVTVNLLWRHRSSGDKYSDASHQTVEGITLGLLMFRWLPSFAPRMKITNHEQVLPGTLLTFLGIGLPQAIIAIGSVPVAGHVSDAPGKRKSGSMERLRLRLDYCVPVTGHTGPRARCQEPGGTDRVSSVTRAVQ